MSDDPRLLRWCERTRVALEADEAERPEALRVLAQEREELQGALQAEKQNIAVSPGLRDELLETEQRLYAMTEQLQSEIQSQLGKLRQVRHAATGYRGPAAGGLAAFFSKSV